MYGNGIDALNSLRLQTRVLPAGAQDMAFNNLPCTLVGMSAMGSEDSAAAEVTAKTFCKCCGPTITMHQCRLL
jgi:hypothetical protein